MGQLTARGQARRRPIAPPAHRRRRSSARRGSWGLCCGLARWEHPDRRPGRQGAVLRPRRPARRTSKSSWSVGAFLGLSRAPSLTAGCRGAVGMPTPKAGPPSLACQAGSLHRGAWRACGLHQRCDITPTSQSCSRRRLGRPANLRFPARGASRSQGALAAPPGSLASLSTPACSLAGLLGAGQGLEREQSSSASPVQRVHKAGTEQGETLRHAGGLRWPPGDGTAACAACWSLTGFVAPPAAGSRAVCRSPPGHLLAPGTAKRALGRSRRPCILECEAPVQASQAPCRLRLPGASRCDQHG